MPAIISENIIGRAAAAIHEHAAARDQALLLALLEYAPTEKGKLNIASRILQCSDTCREQGCWSHIGQLADFFWRNIVIPGEYHQFKSS